MFGERGRTVDCTGALIEVSKDWKTGKFRLTFEINEDVTGSVDSLSKYGKLTIKATKYRKKRSLDANAYAWVLMQKLAEATHQDKWTVYLECLKEYSRAFTHVIVKENAVEQMKELYRTCIDLGQVTVNGQAGHQLQVYYGSSTFDSKEMSIFIDGIVRECQGLGIETMTPADLAQLKAAWGGDADA